MAGSPFTELHQKTAADMSELTADLERMIENTEKLSRMASLYQAACDGQSGGCSMRMSCVVLCSPTVQLTWMAHDIVVMRTNPELVSSLQKLEDAYHRCRAAVCGAPEKDNSPAAPAGTHQDWYMSVSQIITGLVTAVWNVLLFEF